MIALRNISLEEYDTLDQISRNHQDVVTRVRASIIMQATDASDKDFMEILKVPRLRKLILQFEEKGFCGILPCKELEKLLKVSN